MHFWCYCGPLLHEFHHQHVCTSTAFTALWFRHSQMKPRLQHLLLIWCDWEIHCHLCGITLKEFKSWSHSLCFVCTREYFQKPFTYYDSLASDNLMENSALNFWKFTQNWSAVFHKCFGQHFEQNRRSLQIASQPLCSLLWTFVYPPITEHCTPLSYSSFTHYTLSITPLRLIHARLPQHSCF
jgi:hypothetical protein